MAFTISTQYRTHYVKKMFRIFVFIVEKQRKKKLK